jgi:hypothetical protein
VTDTEDVWADLLADHVQSKPTVAPVDVPRRDWLVDLRAATLLQELPAKPSENGARDLISVPIDSLWFQLVTRTHE